MAILDPIVPFSLERRWHRYIVVTLVKHFWMAPAPHPRSRPPSDRSIAKNSWRGGGQSFHWKLVTFCFVFWLTHLHNAPLDAQNHICAVRLLRLQWCISSALFLTEGDISHFLLFLQILIFSCRGEGILSCPSPPLATLLQPALFHPTAPSIDHEASSSNKA